MVFLGLRTALLFGRDSKNIDRRKNGLRIDFGSETLI
jgi:hypothetical protein